MPKRPKKRPRSRPLARAVPALLSSLFLAFLACGPNVSRAEPLSLAALGDSLTAGYGLPAKAAFPVVLQEALRKAGYDVTVANFGVSGDTTAGGVSRIEQALSSSPDGLILELGANDGLRGFEPAFVRQNLETMLDAAKARGVPVLLCGMYALANMGKAYGDEFRAVFVDPAAERDLAFYPFFLDGVFGREGLTLPDGLHPNAEGVREIVRRFLPTAIAFVQSIQADKTAAQKAK